MDPSCPCYGGGRFLSALVAWSISGSTDLVGGLTVVEVVAIFLAAGEFLIPFPNALLKEFVPGTTITLANHGVAHTLKIIRMGNSALVTA